MNPLKHILVVVALLATLLPCSHAALHHGDHHHDADIELCCVEASPCACHSCEHSSCADPVQIQTDRTSEIAHIEHPVLLELLFCLPETKSGLQKTNPLARGILAALQTVRLLI